MKKILSLTITCVLFTHVVYAKSIFSSSSENENNLSTPPKEIVDFIFNDKSISTEDLELRQEQILECLKEKNLKKSDVSKLLSATKIPLGSNQNSEYYFVRGSDEYCVAFYGAHIFQYWFVKVANKKATILLNNSSDYVEVLSSQSHGMNDIEIMYSIYAGSEFDYQRYKFNGSEYVLSECFNEKQGGKKRKVAC